MSEHTSRSGGEGTGRTRHIVEGIFVVVSLVLLADALDGSLLRASSLAIGAVEVPVKRVILFPTFIVSVILLARAWRTARSMLLDGWPILLLVLLAGVSTLWSAAPSVSLSWAVGLAGTTAFGGFLALRYTAVEQMQFIAISTALIAVGSVVVALLAIDPYLELGVKHDGWVGLYLHRNFFGRVMALSVVAHALLAAAAPRTRRAALLGCIVSAVLLALARSRTAEFAAFTSLAAAVILGAAQHLPAARQFRFLLASTAVVVLLAAAIAMQPSWFLAAIGRDTTLTGRVEIWTDVLAAIRARPWLGYGYGAFWRVFALSPGNPNAATIGQSPQAHNAFLDLAAELGVAGELLFLLPFAFYLRRAVRGALTSRSSEALWPPTLFVFLVVANLAESALVRHKIYWALYVAAALLRPRGPGHNRISYTNPTLSGADGAGVPIADRSRVESALTGAAAGGSLVSDPLALKRLLEIVIAAALLVCLLPVTLVCALFIKLGDGGPVLFWQKRVGENGREFWFPKFRSMHPGSEKMHEALRERVAPRGGITLKIKGDPRVTPVGRAIRRLSIDEIHSSGAF